MNKKKVLIPVFIATVFLLFALVLAFPASRDVFRTLSGTHPYVMGFIKFALLALSGELIAVRMAKGEFSLPPYTWARFIIWGVIGVWITYMMKIFFIATGVLMEKGLLPNAENPIFYTFLHALYTSITMNLGFGPTFMALHKISDTYLALRKEEKGVTLGQTVSAVDWKGFWTFTILKTVPLFWIPAHTLTFMLPEEYQVMLAALLSVALGVILNLRKKH